MDDLTDVAAALRALPPSCGPVRLVAVDGHAGSGKSTFATRLADALGGAPVLRLDDLATHEELFAWLPRLLDQVIEPLARGTSARYAPYDWTLRRFGTPLLLEPAPVVLIEGVGAGRRGLRPYLARLLWMDRGAEESWRRGQPARRTGADRVLGRLDDGGDQPFHSGSLVAVRRRAGTGGAGGVRGVSCAARDSGNRTGPSPNVISSGLPAEQSASGPACLQLRLTDGWDRSYVLNVRLFGAAADAKPPVVPP